MLSIYLRLLSLLYFIGFMLHALDIANLRLNFIEMNIIWKIWISYLLIFDLITAIGLWQNKLWGEVLFMFVACTQLIAYSLFENTFSNQNTLIIFHLITVSIYIILKKQNYKHH